MDHHPPNPPPHEPATRPLTGRRADTRPVHLVRDPFVTDQDGESALTPYTDNGDQSTDRPRLRLTAAPTTAARRTRTEESQ
jgi:hypothetical protein